MLEQPNVEQDSFLNFDNSGANGRTVAFFRLPLSYMEGQLADGLPLVVLMTVGGLSDNTKTGRQRQGVQKILRTSQSLD